MVMVGNYSGALPAPNANDLLQRGVGAVHDERIHDCHDDGVAVVMTNRCPPLVEGAMKSISWTRRNTLNGASSLQKPSLPPLQRTAREWTKILGKYREPNLVRSVLELLLTASGFAVLWFMAWAALGVGTWLSLLTTLPAAGFLVRLFMIQHDCGHGAFFRDRAANDWVGRAIGALTLTPYDVWRRSHAIHHASSGNLDHRGIGDIMTLTVREYLALSGWRRLRYRLYRNPFVMFGLGPACLFVVQHRLPPICFMRGGWRPWLSTMATNAAIVAIVLAMMRVVGVKPFLLVHLPTTLLAASIGVWLFYVQHQFEETLWAASPVWNLHEAALHGSSHYELPTVLRWFTANIGVHHVHHLCSRIPFYRLPRVLRDHPEFEAVGRITLTQSLACVRLALWDERHRRLISFCDLRRSSV
jgi:omega-6 fatty acid desaturase (delta-12 desaturase)